MRLKYIFSWSFFILTYFSLGQVVRNFRPINNFFSKVEFVNTPEGKDGRCGLLFYQTDTTILNQQIRLEVNEIFRDKERCFARVKYKGKRGRFAQYNFSITSINFQSTSGKILEVNGALIISANRYHRRLNLQKFRIEQILDGRDTLYTGKFCMLDAFSEGQGNLNKRISTEYTQLLLQSAVGPKYDVVISNTKDVLAPYGLFQVNFDDKVLREQSISSIEVEDLYFKADMDYSQSVIIYCVVRKNPECLILSVSSTNN